jgi:hypothetical protein
MATTASQTRRQIIDTLWRQLNRPGTPHVEIVGDDASLTLACLTDLAYWQFGREIDFVTIPGGYRATLGDLVYR